MGVSELDRLCMGCMAVNKTDSACPQCGFDESVQPNALALPYRTILNKKFLIGKVLGKGGFGITYLAWDLVLQTSVAIKEYMPFTLVGREANRPLVAPHTEEDQKEFEYGLKQFLQEARTLAQFSHANVVRVREFFPANKTAYLVMDYYKGLSLQQFLQQRGKKLSEQEALKIVLPVMNGLAQVHQKGFLHRDIKPDNIYLVEKEHPVLLDFGAARSAFGQKGVSLSVILTPGFAPFEQYLSRTNFTPATDIYSVAATMYYMVSGVKPHEATSRLKDDPIISLATLEPGLTQQFTTSVMTALSVYPENRPQSVEEFQKILSPPPVAQFLTVNAPVKKPVPPPPPQMNVKLGLEPIDHIVQNAPQIGKKYETFYCPHCKTKNIVREGKSLAETKCIKCRKSPNEKINQGLPWLFWGKVALIIPIGLFFYLVLVKKIWNQPEPVAPDVLEKPQTPSTSVEPPAVKRTHAGETRPRLLSPRQNERPEARSRGDYAAEPSPEPPPMPREGAPPMPPRFALIACEDKQPHDSCIANTPRRKLIGVCENIHGLLACIPDRDREQAPE